MSTVKTCFSEKHPKTEDVRGCCSKPNLQTKSMRAEIKLCIYTYIYIDSDALISPHCPR